MPTPTLRILQVSDLHLGGRAWPGCFDLDAEKAERRAGELRATVDRLAELARDRGVEAMLLPGDIFDRETVAPELVNHVIETFAALAPIPVYLAPGNHDFWSPASPYHGAERKRQGQPPWSENVCFFTSPDFTSQGVPGHPAASVTARAFTGNVPATDHRLAQTIARPDTPISILLFHGSRVAFAFEESRKITDPFTAEELLRQGFSYTALGHYHGYSEIRDGAGMLRGAYGGRPFGAELTGNPDFRGGALIGTVTPDGMADLERVSLDPRRVEEVEVHCRQVATREALRAAVEEALTAEGLGAEDLVRLRLGGTFVPGSRPPLACDDLAWAVAITDRAFRPGFDLQALIAAAESEAPTVESLFAHGLGERLAAASDPDEKQRLQDALDLGLCALRGLPLEARDAD